jgi:hypothetical protein
MVLKIRHCKTDKKYLKSFEMWCWRRMEEINWMDLSIVLFADDTSLIISNPDPINFRNDANKIL